MESIENPFLRNEGDRREAFQYFIQCENQNLPDIKYNSNMYICIYDSGTEKRYIAFDNYMFFRASELYKQRYALKRLVDVRGYVFAELI